MQEERIPMLIKSAPERERIDLIFVIIVKSDGMAK